MVLLVCSTVHIDGYVDRLVSHGFHTTEWSHGSNFELSYRNSQNLNCSGSAAYYVSVVYLLSVTVLSSNKAILMEIAFSMDMVLFIP